MKLRESTVNKINDHDNHDLSFFYISVDDYIFYILKRFNFFKITSPLNIGYICGTDNLSLKFKIKLSDIVHANMEGEIISSNDFHIFKQFVMTPYDNRFYDRYFKFKRTDLKLH